MSIVEVHIPLTSLKFVSKWCLIVYIIINRYLGVQYTACSAAQPPDSNLILNMCEATSQTVLSTLVESWPT